MSSWPRVPLGDLVVEERPKRSDSDEPVWNLNLDQIEPDTGRVLERVLVSQDDLGPSTYPFAAGTVLYSKLRPYLNKVVVADESGFATTELVPLRCNPQKAEPSYVAHFLRSAEFLSFANTVVAGAKMPRMVMSEFWKYQVPLPPPKEQRRITTILDKANTLRTKRCENLAYLDRLPQSIFIEMFGDPITNPREWKGSRLGEICEVGSSKRVFVEELIDEGIPFYRGTEVGRLGEGKVVQPSLFISHDHYERLKAEAGVPSKGDLLLPSICPDGRIYAVDTDKHFYFKDARVLWIKVNQSRVNSIFLRHYLKLQFAKNYSKIASGTTFAELKIFALKSLDVHLPPMDLQRRFADTVAVTESQGRKVQSSHEDLGRLFRSLQYRAFRGEL